MNSNNKSTLKDFEVLTKLGQGSFGVVYKVRRKDDKNIYVLKQIDTSKMSRQQRKEAYNEIKILSSFNSPYIVRYFDSFIEKEKINIIMEFCDNGDLGIYLKKQMSRNLAENKIWKFFIQMCLGLHHIHSKKVLHRDIKSINMFLTKEDGIRIGDLGVAKVLSTTTNFAETVVGTPYYLSPELCEEKPYNHKSDVWSLGCVLYEMCTLKHPFDSNNQGGLILKIVRGKYEPIPKIYSKDLSDLVTICLLKDYKQRPSVNDILQKPYIQTKAKSFGIDMNPAPEIVTGSAIPSGGEVKPLPSPRGPAQNSNSKQGQKIGEDKRKGSPEEAIAKRRGSVEQPKPKTADDNKISPRREERKPPIPLVNMKPRPKTPNVVSEQPLAPIRKPASSGDIIKPRPLASVDIIKARPIPKQHEAQAVVKAPAQAPPRKPAIPTQGVKHTEQPKRIRKGAPAEMGRKAVVPQKKPAAPVKNEPQDSTGQIVRKPPIPKMTPNSKYSSARDEVNDVANLPDNVKEPKKATNPDQQPTAKELINKIKKIPQKDTSYSEDVSAVLSQKMVIPDTKNDDVDKFFQGILSEEEFNKIVNETPQSIDIRQSVHLNDFLSTGLKAKISEDNKAKEEEQNRKNSDFNSDFEQEAASNKKSKPYSVPVEACWNIPGAGHKKNKTQVHILKQSGKHEYASEGEEFELVAPDSDEDEKSNENNFEVTENRKEQEEDFEVLNNSDTLAYNDDEEEGEEEENGDDFYKEDEDNEDNEDNQAFSEEEKNDNESDEEDNSIISKESDDDSETKEDEKGHTGFSDDSDYIEDRKANGFDVINEDEDEETKETLADQHEKMLESDLNKLKRRERELNRLILQKNKECTAAIGEAKFTEVYNFYKQKTEAKDEVSQEDMDEIQKMVASENVDIIYNLYKLVYLESEIGGCRKRIKAIEDELASSK